MTCIPQQIRFLITTFIVASSSSIAYGQTSQKAPLPCDGQGTSAGYNISINAGVDEYNGCVLVPMGAYVNRGG